MLCCTSASLSAVGVFSSPNACGMVKPLPASPVLKKATAYSIEAGSSQCTTTTARAGRRNPFSLPSASVLSRCSCRCSPAGKISSRTGNWLSTESSSFSDGTYAAKNPPNAGPIRSTSAIARSAVGHTFQIRRLRLKFRQMRQSSQRRRRPAHCHHPHLLPHLARPLERPRRTPIQLPPNVPPLPERARRPVRILGQPRKCTLSLLLDLVEKLIPRLHHVRNPATGVTPAVPYSSATTLPGCPSRSRSRLRPLASLHPVPSR